MGLKKFILAFLLATSTASAADEPARVTLFREQLNAVAEPKGEKCTVLLIESEEDLHIVLATCSKSRLQCYFGLDDADPENAIVLNCAEKPALIEVEK